MHVLATWFNALPLPHGFMNLHITQLKMLNVVVSLKVRANIWASRGVKINCDNLAVVEVLRSGKAKQEKLFWLHVPGIYGLSLPYLT